jgi:AcrR family transcriptional regulator
MMPRMESPPSGSDRARSAILRAARDHFSREGYDRATIRAIAGDAGIDPALVIRYFGSKDRLFAAAVEIDLRLPDLSSIPAGQRGPALVRHFLERWEGEPADEALLVLLRSAVTHAAAAERMREVFAAQVVPALAALRDPGEGAMRAGLVASQMLGLALCRTLLRLPPVAALDVEKLVALVGPTIERYLSGDRAGPGTHPA